MRKMSKGPATAGGALFIPAVLVNLLMWGYAILFNSINSPENAFSAWEIFIVVLGNALSILTAVILFRRRKDIFAGVVLCLFGLVELFDVISSIASMVAMADSGQTGLAAVELISILGDLLLLAGFVLMGIECFTELRIAPGLKKALMCGAVLAGSLLLMICPLVLNIATLRNFESRYGISISFETLLSTILICAVNLLYSIPASVARTLAAFAVADGEKDQGSYTPGQGSYQPDPNASADQGSYQP